MINLGLQKRLENIRKAKEIKSVNSILLLFTSSFCYTVLLVQTTDAESDIVERTDTIND
jgi:hypothetical protein